MACAIIRILTIDVPVQYGPVRVFSDEMTEVTEQCQYSWSTDSVCWSAWTSYSQYLTTCKNLESDFYLRVKLFTGFNKISINGLFTKCYSMCLDNSNIFAQSLCSESIVNVYANLDCALMMQQQLSDSVICMLGLPIYYFRVTPDEMSADFNFKEYVFHNIASVKYIKMMIQDGTLPSSKPTFTELDFDWENDWEVELSKTQFAAAFGDTAFPKQRDLIYVPMMKRMYEVNSAYDEKAEGLMWRSTTWKLALVKYNEKTNVDKGAFEDIIDTFTVNDYDEIFGQFEEEEAERMSGVNQTKAPRATSNALQNVYVEDGIRSALTKDNLVIDKKQYNQLSNIIGRNIYRPKYDLLTFADKVPYIKYQEKFCYCDFSASFIIETGKKREQLVNYQIVNIGNFKVELDTANKLTIGENSVDLDENKSYLVIIQVDKNSISCQITISEYTVIDALKSKPEYLVPDTKRLFELTNAKIYNSNYNNEWDCSGFKRDICLSPAICGITNFKLWNRMIELDELFKSTFKYVSTDPNMIINDLARPLNDGYGYALNK